MRGMKRMKPIHAPSIPADIAPAAVMLDDGRRWWFIRTQGPAGIVAEQPAPLTYFPSAWVLSKPVR
jgi:hypothetical protein